MSKTEFQNTMKMISEYRVLFLFALMVVALIIAIILIKVVINKLTSIAEEKKAPENKEYLKNTEMNISEISERMGFSTEQSFCRFFRNAEGQSPGQYRMGSLGMR